MTLSFVKMSGAGNDFVLLDNRRGTIRQRVRLARKLCDRHEGIGADGLLLLERSKRCDYTMRYYNADGTDGGMCGNGGRCIAWFAYTRHIAPRNHSFEALKSIYSAKIRGKERVAIAFPDPSPVQPQWQLKGTIPGLSTMPFIDTGSPHAIVRLKRGKLAGYPVTEIGRSVREDRSFDPIGTNVNFVEVHGPSRLSMRTYERGVEAETLACGTGSIACSVTGAQLWGMRSPVRVIAPGGILKVSFKRSDGICTNVELEGDARIVYEGKFHV